MSVSGSSGRPADIDAVRSRIRKLMADVLGRSILDDDDYWESGGDSRQAVNLASLVQSEFGVPFPSRPFFGEPNIDGLSHAVWAALVEHDGG